MINLIIKYLNKIKQFFLIIPILVGIMIFSGLFFASKKSEPEFITKADKVMFDTKNKSPKYIITLHEEDNVQVDDIEDDVIETQKTVNTPKIQATNDDKLKHLEIPFLEKLNNNNRDIPLPNPSQIDYLVAEGGLPIKNNGIEPWEAYGRKVDVLPMFSKIAVVVKNVGINRDNTNFIINRLPEEVSLSFSPYSNGLSDFVVKARDKGHETYIDLLLPSRNYALADNGPKAINFNNKMEDNIALMESLLIEAKIVGGVIISDGVDDVKYSNHFKAIMDDLEKRGLLMLDATRGDGVKNNNVAGLDRVKADIIIDHAFDKNSIMARLEQAEDIALKEGSVVVVIDAKPVAVLAISRWIESFSKQLSYAEIKDQNIKEFERPFALVPLSNLTEVMVND